MSNLYNTVRDQIAAGGDPGGSEPKGGPSAWISAAVVLGLAGWSAVAAPWVLVFVVGLLVSVFLHEMGHYLTSKWTGMKVTQFFMGFGPRLWSRQRGEVEYGVRAFPLGAYVRVVGMNNLDDCAPEDEPRAYRSKSYPRKMLVICAGSLVQFLLAFALFTGIFSLAGVPGETGTVTFAKVVPLVGGGESAAMRAGLRDGDVVVSVDGVAVTTRSEVSRAIDAAKPGDTMELVVERDGETLVVVPTLSGVGDRAYLGVVMESYGWVPTGPVEALGEAAAEVVTTAARSARGVFTVFNPVNLVSNVTADVADPQTRPSTVVGATQVGGRMGESQGLRGVLLLLASVNVVFATLNLFPLLPFDGGHAAIATYERIRSRKGRTYHADAAKMSTLAVVTMVAMLAVFAVGLYLDITQPFG